MSTSAGNTHRRPFWDATPKQKGVRKRTPSADREPPIHLISVYMHYSN
jgi:hypothetical protein